MKKSIFLVLFIALLSSNLFAQRDRTIFSDSQIRLTGVWGGWDVQMSQVNGDYSSISKGFGGLVFNKSVFIGGGGGSTVNDLQFSFDNQEESRYGMDYAGGIIGYTYKSHLPLHINTKVLIGGGEIFERTSGSFREINGENVFVVEPYLGAEVNVFRWFKLGIGGGYRFIDGSDFANVSDKDLSAPFGEVTFKFGFDWGK